MATKTITVTEEAYRALKGLKDSEESFSKTILRVAKKRSLMEFAGVLSEESGKKLEKAIKEMRRRHTATHKARMKRIVKELRGY